MTYAKASKIVQAKAISLTGLPVDIVADGLCDKITRCLMGDEVGPVTFAADTWGEFRESHKAGRYVVSVWNPNMRKHCVAVVDGCPNDPHVADSQRIDWYATMEDEK
jgi:hypothetical protein